MLLCAISYPEVSYTHKLPLQVLALVSGSKSIDPAEFPILIALCSMHSQKNTFEMYIHSKFRMMDLNHDG